MCRPGVSGITKTGGVGKQPSHLFSIKRSRDLATNVLIVLPSIILPFLIGGTISKMPVEQTLSVTFWPITADGKIM